MSYTRDDLQVALVLNGGVSLAVWMSGAVYELDRARCAPVPHPAADPESSETALDRIMGGVLEVTEQRLVVDLIAGTSAGGINGALMAAAIANGRRLRREDILGTWLRTGDMKGLIRPTKAGSDTPSLLLGDDRLLTGLRTALGSVTESRATAPSCPKDVVLMLTGTDLRGTDVFVDRDQEETYQEHRVRFHFTHPARTGFGRLSGDAEMSREEALDRLARAGRSSASFPAAFEVSTFAPFEGMRTADGTPLDAGYATIRQVIDGGVLDNSPFNPILDQIERGIPGGAGLEQTVVYVTPYDDLPAAMDANGATPGALDALGWTSALKGEQAGVTNLARFASQVKRHQASGRSAAMRELLATTSPAALRSAARTLFEAYRRLRWRSVVEDLGLNASPDSPPPAAAWLPDGLAAGPDWSWGTAPVRRLGAFAADSIARARETVRRDGGPAIALCAALLAQERVARRTLAEVNGSEARRASEARAAWDGGRALSYAGAIEASWTMQRRQARANALEAISDALHAAREAIDEYAASPDVAAASAERIRRALGVPAGVARRDLPALLLALEVVSTAAVQGSDAADVPPELSLVTLRGGARGSRLRQLQVHNILGEGLPPGEHDLVPTERKLLGMSLAHFGGFLYGSWRANDWMFGRLDALATIVRLVLSPRRIGLVLSARTPEQIEATRSRLVASLLHGLDLSDRVVRDQLAMVVARGAGPAGAVAVATASPAAMIHDLVVRALRDDGAVRKEAVEDLHAVVIWRLQVEVLRSELPSVAKQLTADRADGAYLPAAIAGISGDDAEASVAAALKGFAAYEIPAKGGLKRQWISSPMVAIVARAVVVLEQAIGRARVKSPKGAVDRFHLIGPARALTLALRALASAPAWLVMGGSRSWPPALVRAFGSCLLVGYLLGSPSGRASYLLACMFSAVLVVPQAALLAISLATGVRRLGRRIRRAVSLLAAAGVGLWGGLEARWYDAPQPSRLALIVIATWLLSIALARTLEREGIDN